MIQATTAAAMLVAASLPAVALQSSRESSTDAYVQPPIVAVYSYAGAYQCGGGCAPEGAASSNSLMLAGDGNYYGATVTGGKNQNGTLFRLTPTGQYTDIFDFNFSPDGATVVTSLMEASDGNLYGVTDSGGANYAGTIFQYNLSTGVFTTVFSFTNGQGRSYSQLVDDGSGTLYGTSSFGGPNQLGNLFSWNYKTSTYTDLFDFNDGVEGQLPWAGIVIASDGRIYGTSRFGGANNHIVGVVPSVSGDGVAWSINTDGTDLQVIHNFGSSSTDGLSPVQGFVEGEDGSLYSTTLYGGGTDCSVISSTYGCGTLYKITPGAEGATYEQIAAFDPSTGQGVEPQHGSPTLGGDGNLYIVAQQGGPNDYGQVMEFTLAGAYTDVHDFGLIGESDTSTGPAAAVIEDQFGNLWGGDSGGGAHQDGEIFKIEAGIAPAMTLTGSSATADLKQPVRLTWNVTNAFSTSAKVCVASSSDGSFTGLKSISGSATVTPATSGGIKYALTCGGSQTVLASVDVSKELVTSTSITSSPSKLVYGQTGTMAVSVLSPTGKVSGHVELLDRERIIATAPVTNGVAQLVITTASLGVGTANLQVKYEGNSEYAASLSGLVPITVTKITPAIQFTINPSVLTDGDPVAVIVSVSNGVGTPGGSVVFSAAGQNPVSVTLTSGSAVFSLDTSSYPAGTYTVTATYEGDADDSSVSATQTVTITKDATVTALAIPSTVVAGSQVSATITVSKPNLPTVPTGMVYLLANGSVIASATLSNGQATLSGSTAGISPGTYTLIAAYLGDSHSAASVSPSEPFTITK